MFSIIDTTSPSFRKCTAFFCISYCSLVSLRGTLTYGFRLSTAGTFSSSYFANACSSIGIGSYFSYSGAFLLENFRLILLLKSDFLIELVWELAEPLLAWRCERRLSRFLPIKGLDFEIPYSDFSPTWSTFSSITPRNSWSASSGLTFLLDATELSSSRGFFTYWRYRGRVSSLRVRLDFASSVLATFDFFPDFVDGHGI